MSALSHSWRRQLGLLRLSSPLGVAAAIALLAAVCSRLASSHYGTAAIAAAVGVPILVAVAQRPLLALIGLLIATASVFSYGTLPRVNLPGHPPINVADLFLCAMIGGTLWRRPWRTWSVEARRYALALALMLAFAGVATLKTSLLGADQTRGALYNFRNFLYLAVALTVALELEARLWKTFLNAAVAFGALVSVASIAAAASPAVAHAISSLSPLSVLSASGSASAVGLPSGAAPRIRLEGLFFVFAMTIPTLVMILFIKDRWRPYRIVAVVLMLGAIAVSLNRNMYIGAVAGLLIAALLGGPRLRARLGVIAAAAAITLTLIAVSSVAVALTSQVGTRASSLFSPGKVAQSGSIADRAYEFKFALPAIARHPWFGIGPRQFYGAYVRRPSGTKVRIFVQNFYVDLATDYGIPTMLAFLLVPGVCLWVGVRAAWRATDPVQKGLLAGAIGSLVALSLSLLVGTYLQDPDSTVAYGVACGVVLALSTRTLSAQRIGR